MTDGSNIAAWTRTDSKVLHVLASVLAQQNRESQAVALLECVLGADPENSSVHRALGGLYLELERFGEALEMADAALAAGPEKRVREGLLLVRCHALWGLGRTEEAEEVMQLYINERRRP